MSLWSACHVAVGPPSATPCCPSDVKMWTISIINSQYKKFNSTYSENYFDIKWYTVGKSMKIQIECAYDWFDTVAVGPPSATPFCPSDVKMWTISIINSQYKKNQFNILWKLFRYRVIYRWKEHEKTNRMSLWSACHVAIGPPSATPFCPSDVKMWTISIINSQYKKNKFYILWKLFRYRVIYRWKEHEEKNRVSLWSSCHVAVGPPSATPFCPSDVKMWTISIINSQYKKINLTYSENYFDIEWYAVGKSMKRQIEWVSWSACHVAVGPPSATPFCPSDVKMWTISIFTVNIKKSI